MKKLINASLFAITGAMIIGSCTKEKVVPINQDNQVISQENTGDINQKTPGEEDALFRLNNGDELVEMNAIEWTDETHFFHNYEGVNIVFTSDDLFLDWAHSDPSREIFVEKYNFYMEQQEFARANGYWDDEEATDRYTQELVLAAGGEGDRVTLSILCDNVSYGGGIMPIVVTYPSLLWFRNRAESMLMPINVGAMCDRTWYRGAKFWYFAFPAGGLPTFLGFNNRAESIF